MFVFLSQACKTAASPTSEWAPANSENRVGTKYIRAGDPGYIEEFEHAPNTAPYTITYSNQEPTAQTAGYSNSGYTSEKSAGADVADELPAPPYYEELDSKM